MDSRTPVLDPLIQELRDTLKEFQDVTLKESNNIFERFVYHLNEEPLAGFLVSTLPDVDVYFEKWWHETQNQMSSAIKWPHVRNKRIALQIKFCRSIEEKKLNYLKILVHSFTNKKIEVHKTFAKQLLDPLVRDIEKLSHSRELPALLNNAMGALPKSGDIILDKLLIDACEKHKDPTTRARAEAVEKLWDAWERIKTLQPPSNKQQSAKEMLDQAAPDSHFRKCLEEEARALTKIGNDFHIRHFEKNKFPISNPKQHDYLFHRLYALIHFILSTQESII
jgi:hypothetical protein